MLLAFAGGFKITAESSVIGDQLEVRAVWF